MTKIFLIGGMGAPVRTHRSMIFELANEGPVATVKLKTKAATQRTNLSLTKAPPQGRRDDAS
jgi:hypothetical protein